MKRPFRHLWTLFGLNSSIGTPRFHSPWPTLTPSRLGLLASDPELRADAGFGRGGPISGLLHKAPISLQDFS